MDRRQALETIILTGIGTSLTGCNILNNDKKQIEDIAINLNESLKRGDTESFMSYFSKDYVLYTSRFFVGYNITAGYLENEVINDKRCAIDYVQIRENEYEELHINVYGNVALISKPFNIRVRGFSRDPLFGEVFILKKELSKWEIVYSTDYEKLSVDYEKLYKIAPKDRENINWSDVIREIINKIENDPLTKEVRLKKYTR